MPRPACAAFAAARRVVVAQVLDRTPPDTRGAMADLAWHGLEDPGFAALRRLDPLTQQGLKEPDPTVFHRLFYADSNGADVAAALRLALRRRAGAAAVLGWVRARYWDRQVGTLLAGQAGWMAEPADPLRLDAALNAPGPAFAALGAANLAGTTEVVALLAGRGWTVQPCVGYRVPVLDG